MKVDVTTAWLFLADTGVDSLNCIWAYYHHNTNIVEGCRRLDRCSMLLIFCTISTTVLCDRMSWVLKYLNREKSLTDKLRIFPLYSTLTQCHTICHRCQCYITAHCLLQSLAHARCIAVHWTHCKFHFISCLSKAHLTHKTKISEEASNILIQTSHSLQFICAHITCILRSTATYLQSIHRKSSKSSHLLVVSW